MTEPIAFERPEVTQDEDCIDITAMSLDKTRMRCIAIRRDSVIITDAVVGGASEQQRFEHSALNAKEPAHETALREAEMMAACILDAAFDGETHAVHAIPAEQVAHLVHRAREFRRASAKDQPA